jgi:RHS repeat-associated protein
MFQPIQIETQSEQQSLTHLHGQRATWGACREFSFDRREQPLDQGAALATPASLTNSRSVGFTGHEADDEFGLINMGGRLYDPRAARFLTPDPFVQAPFSSQSLNRYSYVYNNPVSFADPTGFQCEDADACISGDLGDVAGTNRGIRDAGFEFELGFGGSANPGTTGTSQQPPTHEDATRQGADAGPGSSSLFSENYLDYARKSVTLVTNAASRFADSFSSGDYDLLGALRGLYQLEEKGEANAINHGLATSTDFESIDFLLNVGAPMLSAEAALSQLGDLGLLAKGAANDAALEEGDNWPAAPFAT